ncbi:MAG: hypothetical protein U0183_07020 [Polyangiaceae bacterium]
MASPRRSSLRSTALGALSAFALVSAVEARAEAADKIAYPAACAEVKPSEAEEARKAFVEGKAKSEQALYAEALSAYLTAYRKDCSRHGFLQVISGVLERQGEYDEAVRALELYLARQNLAPADRAPIETRVANLRTAAEEKRKREAKVAPAVPPPSGEPSPRPGAPPATTETREHGVLPWVVFGVGGLAIGTGVVLTVVGGSTLPPNCNVETLICSAREGVAVTEDQADARLSRGFTTGGIVTIVGGGVLMVGGLLWHFLEPTGPVEKTSSLPRPVPVIGSGYGGLVLGGRF